MSNKKRGNEPAFPYSKTGEAVMQSEGGTAEVQARATSQHRGLTKRELFAGLAMMGYVSAGSQGMPSPERLAELAAETADALCAELAKDGAQ